MQQARNSRRNQRTFRQQVPGRTLQNTLMERDALCQQVRELNDLLGRERANFLREQGRRVQLCQELEETKKQLIRQKRLKEMYINRGKETKRELQRFQKYSDGETLSTAKIAAQVHNNIKQKKKKLLQKDYEELQVAHMIRYEKFSAELQVEKEKSKFLQEELERIKVSHHEVCQKYEAEVLTVRQQADNLLRELETEKKAHAERVKKDLYLVQYLRAEQVSLHQKMAEEMKILQRNSLEKERFLGRELEELKTKLNIQTSLNLELSTELEREDFQPPRRKIARREDEPRKQEESRPSAPAPKLLEEAKVSEEKLPETTKPTSAWKRALRRLGLKKPQKKKGVQVRHLS
ncbi:trichohyalin-like [Enoplosus armatus]|uniref:trichohyalin-like n=1 Tax=Enoplosus armatus TaxID=215367 RepID=UPI003994EF8B